ncbi:cache domain-containing protein [Derxia gummosa]|uniref:Cache domain-containing protein n=1 Tax=Derxia gummosa DSM 723 TaxID=1121388 RepID=A0A8B6X706_9BURK|nr:cache domain-containing protein [Derxia gummosa]
MSANPPLATAAPTTTAPKVRFGLRQRLLVVLLLATLVPICALWASVRNVFADEAHAAAEARLRVIGDAARAATDQWIAETRSAVELIAAAPTTRAMNAPQTTRLLQTAGHNRRFDTVYLWHVVAPDGSNVARSDERDPADFSYGERSYVRDTLAGKPFSIEVGMGKTRKVPTVILAVPIRSETGGVVGVMAAATSLDLIAREFAAHRAGETNRTFLVHEDGRLIIHTDRKLTDHFEDFSGHPAYLAAKAGNTGFLRYTDADGDQFAWISRTEQGWFVVTQLTASEVLRGVVQADRFALGILVVTVIAVSALAWLVAGSFARPIVELTTIADRISRGSLDDDIPAITRSDEIGALAQAIGRLSKSMKLAMTRLRRA